MRSFEKLLKIPYSRLDDINAVLLDPDTAGCERFSRSRAKYGTPEEINRKARAARQLPALLATG